MSNASSTKVVTITEAALMQLLAAGRAVAKITAPEWTSLQAQHNLHNAIAEAELALQVFPTAYKHVDYTALEITIAKEYSEPPAPVYCRFDTTGECIMHAHKYKLPPCIYQHRGKQS